jgi:hypothetical protein
VWTSDRPRQAYRELDNIKTHKARCCVFVADFCGVIGRGPFGNRGIRARAGPSSTYSAFHSLPNSSCYWSCRNPCLFDVELATQSLSLFLTNQINRNLVHLKRPQNCTHFSAYTLHTQRDVHEYFLQLLLAVKFVQELENYHTYMKWLLK